MARQQEHAVTFTAKRTVSLEPTDRDDTPLGPGEIEGRTLVSLVSSGTETVGVYAGEHYQFTAESYPCVPGYANVFRVEAVGSDVRDIVPGDVAIAAHQHRSSVRTNHSAAVVIPEGLSPEVAVFARIAKIAWPVLAFSGTRPPEKAVVTGLGAVGLMASQLCQAFGYETIACEPRDRRRQIAEKHDIRTVLPSVPLDDEGLCKHVGLGLECSGHEQAALDICNVLRPFGELFLVGVPWVARTNLLAQKVLHSVFYNFVTVRSGWEVKPPNPPEVHGHRSHVRQALRWLAEGRIKVDETVYRRMSPRDAQEAYEDIYQNRLEALTVMFDWRDL
jgi:threonine dehydrogenase-like Zn-dependent dehydrogenase